MSTSSQNDNRASIVAGFRDLADWLETTPTAPIPSHIERDFTVPLHTNDAVQAAADALGLETVADDEGNLSCDATFGPISWRMYGYVDFKAHCETDDERRARSWAARKGMEITPVGGAA